MSSPFQPLQPFRSPPRLVAVVAMATWGVLCCQRPGEQLRQVLENAQAEAAPALAKLQAPANKGAFQAPRAAVGPQARLTVLNQGHCQPEIGSALAPGLNRLSVQVELEAFTDFGIAVNRYYAHLVDRDSRKFPAVLDGCEPAFERRPLLKGELSRGWLNFVVPKSVREFHLTYAPRLVDGSYAAGMSVPIGN